MTAPLPSLALEMSMDGIALHQLAFDGHWHELARVGLADAALREKMANMHEIAQRLEGRRFKVRVWLPNDQIIRETSETAPQDQSARETHARDLLGEVTPHAGAEFAVAVNSPAKGDQTWIAGARHKTMHEACAFAKSHGFNATVYSTKNPIEGFVDKPYFKLPPNRIRTIGLGLAATVLVGSVVAGGIAFRVSDPYLWWETPPEAAGLAPFQNPDLALDRSTDNVLPFSHELPVFTEIASIDSQSLREPFPFIPARRLDATALEFVSEPPALHSDTFDIAFSTMPEDIQAPLPSDLAQIPSVGSADKPPSLGLYNVLTTVVPITSPDTGTDTHAANLPPDISIFTTSNAPATVASIRFVLEPLPSMAATMSLELQHEITSTFDVAIADITPPLPTVLAETQVVDVIRTLPDILPKLRSGAEIPPQVAILEIQPTVTVIETIPADAETIANAVRGFALIQGRPEIEPVRRVVPPPVIEPVEEPPIIAETTPVEVATVEEPPVFTGEISVVNGQPDLLPLLRSGNAIPEPGSIPEPVEEPPVVDETAPEIAPIEVATVDEPPIFTGEISVVNGQPDLLPLLRSGNAIPEPGSVPEPVEQPVEQPIPIEVAAANITAPPVAEIPAGEVGEVPAQQAETAEADPAVVAAIAIANALRATRRPQSIVDMAEPIDPMMSDAAPALAEVPSHRGEGFAANAARIAEIASNRPRAVAPVVPADPQTVNLPTTASVARAATIEDGINLRKTSLIGIFGTADNREVLIRLASGRILQLGLGDTFSGWRVVAIGEDSIRIQKGSRTEILRLPN